MKITALQAASAILETIAETPDGAPSGVIYSAMQRVEMDYHTYTTLIEQFKTAGLIRQTPSHLLFPTDKLLGLIKTKVSR